MVSFVIQGHEITKIGIPIIILRLRFNDGYAICILGRL